MKMRVGRLFTLLALAALLLPATAMAAGGGGAAPLVIVVDTRAMSGLMAWWGNLYNESHAMFTLMTVVLIPSVGCIFGMVADFIMHFVGIDLSSRELAEH